MKAVIIFGYYGRGNLGDETNLEQLVTFIRTVNPELPITVISANPLITSTVLGVAAVGKTDLKGIINSYREAGMLIGGGGNLFQDCTSLRSLIYYSFLVLLAKAFQLRVALYGQGIGPLHTAIGRILAGRILAKADLITVRDRYSIVTLAELNAIKPQVHFTAEPLLLNEGIPATEVTSYWEQRQTRSTLKLGLIIRPYRFIPDQYWRDLLEALGWERTVSVYLIPMEEQDYHFEQKLTALTGETVLPTSQNWREFQALVGGFDLIVSCRLHGLVAAVNQGIPCYGLAADSKIEGFCLQLGLTYNLLTTEHEPSDLARKITQYLYQPLEKRRPWIKNRIFWRTRARENQIILKDFLQQES
jgi:polysaccharide pyruvyl transferase CsaB